MTRPDPHSLSPAGLPRQGRLIGIDYGTVRVGIAVCDVSQSIASPLETYHRRNERLDAAYFQRLVDEQTPVGFVIGVPLHLSGDESEKSKEARAFGRWIAHITGKDVDWIDERFSTAYARELLSKGTLTAKQKKARLDKVAAQAILAVYLETPRKAMENRALDD